MACFDPETQFQSLTEQADHAYRHFRARPDQPERYDQQAGFFDSKTRGVSFIIGGNGAGTTEICCAKIAKLVLRDEPPPRHDTPFWIISNSFERVCKAAWKEKLFGHAHIPKSEMDWDRISWFRVNQNLAFEVPLKPWPGRPGKNWSLVFKSYEQGRHQMQAESIGGFCFIEQFPWEILTEVLRGCREYNFRGSKFCEFTPVDPNMSIELEEMIEKDDLPVGWEIYRANTLCAVEAGHVSSEWFDEFFGMVPKEMLETRLTGHFATYEGSIYTQFNPAIHLVGDDVIDFPSGVYFRRGIDWGAGPENAFCCEWAYFNGMGQCYVFDEYYSTEPKTTIDHLCEVQERSSVWGWDVTSPMYGTTWADPSSPDNIRIASKLSQYCPRDAEGNPKYEPLSMSRGNNAVNEGIEYVQYLLQVDPVLVIGSNGSGGGQPRLYIHKENCPYLARQMRTYRWKKSTGMGANPADARREPLKKNDHSCDAIRYMLFSEANISGVAPSSTSRHVDHKRRGIQFNR